MNQTAVGVRVGRACRAQTDMFSKCGRRGRVLQSASNAFWDALGVEHFALSNECIERANFALELRSLYTHLDLRSPYTTGAIPADSRTRARLIYLSIYVSIYLSIFFMSIYLSILGQSIYIYIHQAFLATRGQDPGYSLPIDDVLRNMTQVICSYVIACLWVCVCVCVHRSGVVQVH